MRFYKFHGAGNDFVLIDNRIAKSFTSSQIAFLADRKYGIGADGIILLESGNDKCDFKIHYFNADGLEASLCGNGSRCAVAFANRLGIIGATSCFDAFDGLHHGEILEMTNLCYKISITMNDVTNIKIFEDGYFLDTGSPHFVSFVEAIEEVNVVKEGLKLRYDSRFLQGTNVNFVAQKEKKVFIRTYERGVENETLSCGTGVTATALVVALQNRFSDQQHSIQVNTLGGNFTVSFKKAGNNFRDIRLIGPVEFVFQGEMDCIKMPGM
jgi:diaminopimelate epimerase